MNAKAGPMAQQRVAKMAGLAVPASGSAAVLGTRPLASTSATRQFSLAKGAQPAALKETEAQPQTPGFRRHAWNQHRACMSSGSCSCSKLAPLPGEFITLSLRAPTPPRAGYFTKAELKQIIARRRDFEYKLKRRAALKIDFYRCRGAQQPGLIAGY